MHALLVTLVLSLVDANPTDHTGLGLQANQQIALYIGVLIPIAVALVTKKFGNSAKEKAGLLLGLNLLNGFLTELLGTGDFHFWSAVNGVILSLVTGVVALFGIYMPTGLNDKLHNTLRKDDPQQLPSGTVVMGTTTQYIRGDDPRLQTLDTSGSPVTEQPPE